MKESTAIAPTAKQSAVPQQITKPASGHFMRDEDHATFLYTAILNAAFRAEELGVTPEQFLEICRAAAAPHHKLVASEEMVVEPSQRLRELGVTPEVFLEMCETITGVMRQLLMEDLG
jgi:hypothetical protein